MRLLAQARNPYSRIVVMDSGLALRAPRNDERNRPMTLTTTTDTPRAEIDWTKPVLWLFAAFLVLLIVLPLSWLALYRLTDRDRHLPLQNFVKLFTDPDF